MGCDCCGDLANLIIRYNRDVNEIVTENDDFDHLSLKPLTRSEVDILFNYIQLWQQRHCSCLFKDASNVDRLNSLVRGLLLTSINLLKQINRSLSEDGAAQLQPDQRDRSASDAGRKAPRKTKFEHLVVDSSGSGYELSSDEEEEECNDAMIEEAHSGTGESFEHDVSRWPLEDKEKLLHLVSKVFYIHFPLYTMQKASLHPTRLDDLTQKEVALLTNYCDLNDPDVSILLLRNLSFYCVQGAMELFVSIFEKATPVTLPLTLAHAIIAVINHLKYGLNVNRMLASLVSLRTSVINYLCKVPEKDLKDDRRMSERELPREVRTTPARSIFEYIWTVIKEPLDQRNSIVDKEGLMLALKYFTSSTLTMRIAGITQINNYIGLLGEFSQSDNLQQNRQLEGYQEDFANWILQNKIIEHIFGPNLHVEVIKQSHTVLNFVVARITAEHVDAIWTAAQLKHCSRQVLDLLNPLVKNMSINSVLHLYTLLRNMDVKEHTEQTLQLASSILKTLWTKALNIPIPENSSAVTMKVCGPMGELASNVVKSSLYILPAREDQSSTSGSPDGSDDEDGDFDPAIEPQKGADLDIDDDYDGESSWATGSSNEDESMKEVKKVKLTRKPLVGADINKQAPPKSDSESESDDEMTEKIQQSNFIESTEKLDSTPIFNKLQLADESSPGQLNSSGSLKELNESCDDPIVELKKDESSTLPGQEPDDETLLSDSNSCHSSPASLSSVKNMEDFDGEEESDVEAGSTNSPRKPKGFKRLGALKTLFHKTPFIASQSSPSAVQLQNEGSRKKSNSEPTDAAADLSKFTIENVCRPQHTLLWDLLQEDSIGQLAEGLALECEKVFCQLICWLSDKRIRMKFIEGCLENLENNRSVIISLRLLPKLFHSFQQPQQYRTGLEIHIHKVTLWADSERHMLRHFFSNLILYYSTRSQIDYTSKLYNHLDEIQTRLQFLTFIFSSTGSPESFKLNKDHVDTLWSCLADDKECRDELFQWLLNQIRIREHHALSNETLQYVLKEKMPLLRPESFTMPALDLLHHSCHHVLAQDSFENVNVAIKQLWDIALTSTNSEVSMSAIKHLNNYYIHVQNINGVALDKEEEFIEECMNYLRISADQLSENEEKHSTVIQRALTLLKTHLEVFRCRYSYHLRKMQLNGDTSIISHRLKSNDRAGQQGLMRVICQSAVVHEKTQFEMHGNDYMGELRAEITHWWSLIIGKNRTDSSSSPSTSSMSLDGPLRLLSQGQELLPDMDEKTLSEIGIKDMQIVYLSIGANRHSKRAARESLEPASILPPPPKANLPSILLLKNSYFEQLFDLTQQLGSMQGLSQIRSQILSRRVWDIIQLLPTSPDLLSALTQIHSPEIKSEIEIKQPQSISPVFVKLLSPKSPQKLLYSVQIVDWLRRNSKKEDNWSKRFVDSGGLQHIFDIFVSGTLNQGEAESSCNEWKQDCLTSLMQLIYHFGINQFCKAEQQSGDGVDQLVKKKQRRKASQEKLVVHQFNNRLLTMLNDVDSMVRVLLTILHEASSRTTDANCYQTGFWGRAQVIHHTIIFLTSWMFSDFKVHKSFFQAPNVSSLLKRLVLDDPDPSVRREACTTLYRMCQGSAPGAGKNGHMFIPQLLNALLSFLPVAQNLRSSKILEFDDITFVEKQETYGPGCKDYFWVVCRLVDALEKDDEKSVNFDKLSVYLSEAIVKREIRESRHINIEDEGLRGLLQLMTMTLRRNPPFKSAAEGQMFLKEIFDSLFALPMPTARNLPKCKALSTRSTAFDLLVEFAKGNEENHSTLINLLKEQHESSKHSPYPWDFWPHDDCRSECGYVGLINLGATCYMASCLQHLFMLPDARNAILSAKASKDTKHEPILLELQRMFAFLLESERKSYNPRSFCKVYTMNHELLNTGEQKDMTEFFTDLISKFEEMTPDLKNMVKSLFGGTLSNNVVSLDCDHISRTSEEFYTLRCKVADMRNLWDSLDELTVKDMLEGDNMYTCSQCGRKVRAEKRACIKKLPRILCFNTMRYTFNMITMTKEKVNTHFSFPARLDMAPYLDTLEENLIKTDQNGSSGSNMESTEYELIGITVHTGTAEGGHYYSFIRERENTKDRDKWYMFNDAEVKNFDPLQIASECFGGEMTSKTYDSVTDKFHDFSFEKTNSAYMLFYERLPTSKSSPSTNEISFVAEETSAISQRHELSDELSTWIWKDNMQFARDKFIFDHTYFELIWQMCNNCPLTIQNSSEDMGLLSTQLATNFVLETLIHSKEKPTIGNWLDLLTKHFNSSKTACEWFLDHLTEETQWPVQILLKCPSQMVRQLFHRICIHVITQLRPTHHTEYLNPTIELTDSLAEDVLKTIGQCSCVTRFIKKLLSLIRINNLTKPHPKHLTEYFSLLYEFAKMGEEEVQFLLAVEAISAVVQFYLSHSKVGNDFEVMSDDEDEDDDDSLVYPAYRGQHGPSLVLEEKNTKPASLDKMITFVAYLVEKSRGADNQLRLSANDQEAIFNGKQFPFLQRQIRDSINLRQSCNLLISLCRYNEAMASQVTNMLLNSISRQPESSGPFFRLLSMFVDINPDHIGIPVFSSYIYPRIWEIAEQCPQNTLEWLTMQVPRNKAVHSLVLNGLERWVEYFLLSHNNQRVRNAAALLLIALVPSPSFRNTFNKTTRLMPVHRDNLDMSSEALGIAQQIFNFLLNLLIRAKIYADPQTHGTQKLTSYFNVMNFCISHKPDKASYFTDHTGFTEAIWNLFQPKLSEPAIAINHNKQSLLAFWHLACLDDQENIKAIVSNPIVAKNIAFNYILADHDDQDVILFNRIMLPSYYGLLRLCCQQSRTFTRQLATHQNIQWAFKNITPYSNHYPNAVADLFKLMKLFIAIYPDTTEQEQRDIRQFKRTTLQIYLTSIDPRNSWSTVVTALTTLVESEEDRSHVIVNNGVHALIQSFNTLFIMFHEATACHVTTEIAELLKLLTELLATLKTTTVNDVRDFIPKLKEHGEFVRKLIHLLNTYVPPLVRVHSMAVLNELMQIYPKDSLPLLVQSLGLCHLTFQDQNTQTFLAGPYFPRRGQRVLLTKSSLRPQRPIFQMHFHPTMLDGNFGTDAEYDKAVIEYFFNYYKFVADICKIAVQNKLVNQELIGFCSMVALESLPMHLPIFPKLWLEFYEQSEAGDEASQEFINLLCTSCNYFRDYINQILSAERIYLADDCAFKLIEQFVPKVQNFTISTELNNKITALISSFVEKSEKISVTKDFWQLIGDFRALYLVLNIDKGISIGNDFKEAVCSLQERITTKQPPTDGRESPDEIPQKKRKKSDESNDDGELSGDATTESTDRKQTSDMMVRLESTTSKLIQLLLDNN